MIKLNVKIIAILFMLINITYAQKLSNYEAKLKFRTMPISLIDIFQHNLTVGLEYDISKNQSLSFDYSHIFYQRSLGGENWLKGFIMRPTYKFYLYNKREYFFEVDFIWKKTQFETFEWHTINSTIPNLSYSKRIDIVTTKNVIGTNFKVGTKINLYENKFFIEPYAGFGIRRKTYTVNNNEGLMVMPRDILNEWVEENTEYWTIAFPAGVRLVWSIK